MDNLTAIENFKPAPHRRLSAPHTTAIALGDPLPALPAQMQRNYRETERRRADTAARRWCAWVEEDGAAEEGYRQQEAALIARLAGLAAAYYDATGHEIEPGRIVGTAAA